MLKKEGTQLLNLPPLRGATDVLSNYACVVLLTLSRCSGEVPIEYIPFASAMQIFLAASMRLVIEVARIDCL
jgi:hypothetical protein